MIDVADSLAYLRTRFHTLITSPQVVIDNLAAAVLDLLLDRQFRAKRRHDDHVLGLQIGNVGLLVFAGQVLDA